MYRISPPLSGATQKYFLFSTWTRIRSHRHTFEPPSTAFPPILAHPGALCSLLLSLRIGRIIHDTSPRFVYAAPTLTYTGWMQANHHITKSAPALTYDINKLNDAGITPSITEALTQIPPVPWHTDVHTHAALLETQILTILELYCPKDKRTARKKWLSENTTSIAQVKGRCFTTLRRYHGL